MLAVAADLGFDRDLAGGMRGGASRQKDQENRPPECHAFGPASNTSHALPLHAAYSLALIALCETASRPPVSKAVFNILQ